MWTPVDHVLGVLMNMLSRKNEFQADAYATQLGYAKGLQSGLVKLQLENLGNMVRGSRVFALSPRVPRLVLSPYLTSQITSTSRYPVQTLRQPFLLTSCSSLSMTHVPLFRQTPS